MTYVNYLSEEIGLIDHGRTPKPKKEERAVHNGYASLLSAVAETNKDHRIFDGEAQPSDLASPEAHTQVGGGRHISGFWRDLAPAERDLAIELAELKQTEYEQSGQHQRAQWMRDLQAHLIAGRNQGAKA